MSKIRIIADNKIPFLKGALEEVADIEYLPGGKINNDSVKSADAMIIRTRTRCDEELLKDSKVSFIASATIGYDHIDTDYCESQGIKWTNAPGCNSSSVEQYVTSALLTFAEKYNFRLKDRVIGIVGVGNVGRKVSRVANSLGMKVLHNDQKKKKNEGSYGFYSLDEIKDMSDIITFHVPLNTRGEYRTLDMVDRNFLTSLKNEAIIINTSRGEILDENALKQGLSSGKIKDAIIDVWRNEPLIDPELVNKCGIATSHIAGYSVDGKAKGAEMSVRAVSDFFGLGRNNWSPSGLPGPEINNIVIDCGSMSEEEIVREVYTRTYDIMKDDESLRNNLEKFEDLRGNYPVRREPSNYYVRLNNNPFEYLEEVLEEMGFSVLELDCFC